MITSDIINLILQRYKMLCVKYPQSPSFIPNNKGDSFYLIRKGNDIAVGTKPENKPRRGEGF